MNRAVFSLVEFIQSYNGIANKEHLSEKVRRHFNLTKDRSVYYSEHFAIRFSFSSSATFSNTVIALSTLQKYDDLPFIVCLVTASKNILYLANTTLLQKVSHSSQDLRVNNIRGSVNGSDIIKVFNGITNEPHNFEELFNIHAALGFNDNLPRLVEETHNIVPSGSKFSVSDRDIDRIIDAPDRAKLFINSSDYLELKSDLDTRVSKVADAILVAGFIENRNIRGRIIEYMITGEDDARRKQLIDAVVQGDGEIRKFRTTNDLADYRRNFSGHDTATEVKTKIMILNSNPKAYNIDKLLEYLSNDRSVFMFYFIRN